MNYVLKAFISFLIVISFFSYGYSDISCCYSIGKDSSLLPKDACSVNEINVGPVSDPRQCFALESKRLCYKSGNNLYSLLPLEQGNSRIYDFDTIKSLFLPKDDFEAYSSSCLNTAPIDIDPGPGDDDDGFIYPPPFDDLPDYYDDNFKNTSDYRTEFIFCSESGEPYGFFSSKKSCESLEKDGKNICLFNPKNAGFFSTKFENMDILNLFDEVACVPKSGIMSCFEYNTKENCENNFAYDFAKKNTKLLDSSCVWIENSQISSNPLFSNKNGFCIPKTPLDKAYNIFIASYRANLIQNPSFEYGLENWNGDGEIIWGSSYHAYNSLKLSGNISQEIEFVGEGISYIPYLYGKRLSPNSNETLSIIIYSYDKENNLLETSNPNIFQMADLELEYGYFKLFRGTTYTIPNGTNKIKYMLSVLGGEMHIDGISLEVASKDTSSSQRLIFKPLTILPQKASNCELCFDSLNFNFCTQGKSDILGECTYMSEDINLAYKSNLGNYLGKDANYYLLEKSWESQSIASTMLFCEMYTQKDICLDSQNYVNKKFSSQHPILTGQNLCKWSDNYGCYKDSDNNNFPDLGGFFGDEEDLSQSLPYIRALDTQIKTGKYFENIDKYQYKNSSDKISDFLLSCDSLPPVSYLYFSAKNSSGDLNIIESSLEGIYGSLFLSIDISDAPLETCKFSGLKPRIIIDYEINGKPGYKIEKTNILVQKDIDIKTFFLNSSGGTLLEEGINEISIKIMDQSGNIGYIKNFNLDLDLYGPEIKLISPNDYIREEDDGFDYIYINPVLSNNSILKFNASDLSNIKSCTYELDDSLSDAKASDVINKSGNFSFEISNNIGFSFPLSEHILNSSDNGDFYTLNIECSDIYDQTNLLKVSFMVDMQLGVKIISPMSFIKLEDRIATHKESFFNKDVLFHAVSTENYGDITCSLEFEGETPIFLSIETIEEGFENSKYPELTFYKNISGTISFSNEGKKEGNLKCLDENENENNIPLTYYYEKTKPILESFTLNSSGTIKPKNLIEIDGNFYLRNIGSVFFDTNLDGTISWIDLNDGLKLFVQGEERFELSGTVFMTDKYNESNTKNNVNIRNFYNPLLYEGVDGGEDNLRLFSYEFEFNDLAGNNETYSLTFYYDNSSPKFIFNGDSVIEASNGILYTRYENPQFDISFNTPSYRTFECNITGKQFGDSYKKSFPFSNNLKFALSEIISNLDLRTFGSANLDFDCTDIYGINLRASYLLKFDDINPILNDMFLDRGNKKYYSNAENIHYENLIDKIVFELNDTNEDGYICKYNFNSNSDYACNESIFEIEFSDFGFMKTSDLKILSVDEEDSICKRTASFKSSLDSARSSGNDYNTIIKVDGQCFDYSGLESESKSFNIEINYVDSFIVDFEIKVVDGGYYPFVSTWKDFAGGFKISLDEEGTENNTLGFANIKNEEEDLFVYTSNSPLDVSDLESGEYLVWALAIHNDKIIERINTIMIIDKGAPILSLKIPDMMEGNIIYAEEFLIDMFSKDLEKHMKNISLFVGGTFLYEQNRTNLNYDSNLVFVNPADSYCQDDICVGKLIFKNASIGSSYTFTLIANDYYGNSNSTSLTIEIKEGIYLKLLNSSNSIVDPSGFSWITKNNAPIIRFTTLRDVTRCFIFPFLDEGFDDSLKSKYGVQGPGNEFSFDLSSSDFNGFDLTKTIFNQADILISCIYNDVIYNYTRSLKLVNYLPDYVLSSSEGFVIADSPYKTNISVLSVGPYRYISCQYDINGGQKINFEKNNDVFFEQEFDFSAYLGEINLNLLCEDSLGTKGPAKTYKFIIDKSTNIEILKLSLKRNENVYDAQLNTVYIPSVGNYEMELNTNRKGVSCNYQLIKQGGGFFSGIIEFFKNLFGMGKEQFILDEGSFVFKANINLEDKISNLIITCSKDSNSNSKDFKFEVVDDIIDFEISS